MYLLVAVAVFGWQAAAQDICDASATGFTDASQEAVVCYTGNFLVKMLGELDAGQNKTVEHVRVHLLPYLGGVATLKALNSDDPDDPNCTVCYTDAATSMGLTGLRNSLSASQLSAYDKLSVCYARLTQRLLDAMPQSRDGIWLARVSTAPFQQVVDMFTKLFGDSSYDSASCPKAGM